VIFIMRLLAAAAVANNRIAQTNRAPAEDRPCASLGPIDGEVVLCGRK
jgi:hypothetical protein